MRAEDSENHLYLVLGWGLETEGENKLRSVFQTLHPLILFPSLTKKLCLKEEHIKYLPHPTFFLTKIKLLFLNEVLSVLPISPQAPPAPWFFSQLSKPRDHV